MAVPTGEARLPSTVLGGLVTHLRSAARSLVRERSFTASVVLTLTLGLGGCLAVFTVVRGVLLAPLPFSTPDRLTRVWMTNPQQGFDKDVISYPNFATGAIRCRRSFSRCLARIRFSAACSRRKITTHRDRRDAPAHRRPLTSRAIGMLLRNQLYAGIADLPEDGVRAKRGDFEPLISEDLFYRGQAVLSGRLPSTTPKHRAHPDFPLRATSAASRGDMGLQEAHRANCYGSKWRFANARPEPDFR